MTFDEVQPRLRERKISPANIENGLLLFVVGLVYKVMLANQIAALWNDVMVSGVMGINTATAWLGAWGYSMQIYFDFLGYSLMAIGMGYMLGFRFPKNFPIRTARYLSRISGADGI